MYSKILSLTLIATLYSHHSSAITTVGHVAHVSNTDKKSANIQLHSNNKLHVGQHLRAGRLAPDFGIVKTASLRVISMSRFTALAEVVKDGSQEASQLLDKFPQLMEGDLVWNTPQEIKTNVFWASRISLGYDKIFVDPNPNNHFFKVSPAGMQRLAKIADHYGKMPIPRLFIKGFSQQEGSHKKNQAESYQRALAVRNYLVYTLGFDPDRVIAVGHGEIGRQDTSYSGQHQKNNRRIEFEPTTSDTTPKVESYK
ncbi:MAG: OmpA family protein [Zetaproteobacteria bacterium]|nr:OmpA family protein [Zetaproteobacteria bacterium]